MAPKRKAAAQTTPAALGRRAGGHTAATARKRRVPGLETATTRKGRDAGRKAALTRKRRHGAQDLEEERRPPSRRIFLIAVDHGIELAIYTDTLVSVLLGELLDNVLPLIETADDKPGRLARYADCLVLDDAMRSLPEQIRVGSIPAPGIIYVIPRTAQSLADLELEDPPEQGEGHQELNLPLLRELVYNAVRRDDSAGRRLSNFISGPDALFEPDPLPTYDVFVSFTTADFLTSAALALRLRGRGVTCFFANTTISAGTLWSDELRIALQSSRRVVLVASGHAADSSWVWNEIGAAWALGLPIIVATTGTSPEPWTSLLKGHDVTVVPLDEVVALPELQAGATA